MTQSGLVSGLSLLDALALLAPGATGPAATSLTRLLGPGQAAMAELHQRLAGTEGLRRASAVWLPAPRPALPAYLNAVAPFGPLVETIDFGAPPALGRINGWVAQRTANFVPALLDRMPREAGLLITAALHFSAGWAAPFDPSFTRPGPFQRGDGRRVTVSVMRGTQQVEHAQTRAWQAVRLPYADAAFEAVLMAPAPGRPASQAIEAVRERRALAALAALRFAPAQVDLTIPRLAMDRSSDLLSPLRQAGIAPEGEFRGITGAPIRISAIRQRTVLRVDEAGTEAAAATAIFGDRGLIERPRFVADRPFIFLVIHKNTGLHVVSALVNDPGSA